MSHHHHAIAPAIALTLALATTTAPAAWGDPAPLARAEAAIASASTHPSQSTGPYPTPQASAEPAIAATARATPAVRPNADEQTLTQATVNSGPCSEACSGGGYGLASSSSGARLPHNPRPGSPALSPLQKDALAAIKQGAEQAGLHPGVFGPGGAADTSRPIVRASPPSGGFHWGDAGVGAGGTLALILIGAGGVLTVARRRNHAMTPSTTPNPQGQH